MSRVFSSFPLLRRDLASSRAASKSSPAGGVASTIPHGAFGRNIWQQPRMSNGRAQAQGETEMQEHQVSYRSSIPAGECLNPESRHDTTCIIFSCQGSFERGGIRWQLYSVQLERNNMFNAPLDHGCGQQSHWSTSSEFHWITSRAAILPQLIWLVPLAHAKHILRSRAHSLASSNILQHITTYYNILLVLCTSWHGRQMSAKYQTWPNSLKVRAKHRSTWPEASLTSWENRSFSENLGGETVHPFLNHQLLNMAIWGISQSFLDTPTYPMCHFETESLVTGY